MLLAVSFATKSMFLMSLMRENVQLLVINIIHMQHNVKTIAVPACQTGKFKNCTRDSQTGKKWHIWYVNLNGGLPRVHFMHLGPKIFFSVHLTFCRRSGVISSIKSVLGMTAFEN